MSILKRYKDKGLDGFKKIVQSVEQSEEEKQKSILQAAFLEDPVYAYYIPQNVITFEFILDFNQNSTMELWARVQNPARIFLFAFFGTPDEKKFLDEMATEEIAHEYKKEKEVMTSVKVGQRRKARLNLIEKVRELQQEQILVPFQWKLPPENILTGDHFQIPKSGEFILKYPDGSTALKGSYEDKLRSGVWEHYFINGQVMARGIYNLNEKEDLWEYYFSNGKLKAKGRYFQNLKEGDWFEHDKYGIQVTVNYTKGQKSK